MIRIFIIILAWVLLLVVFSNCSFIKGQVRAYELRNHSIECDSNKANLIVQKFVNEINHGGFEQYDSLGCLVQKGEYKKGKKRGLWEYYFNGQLNYLIFYSKNDTMVWKSLNVSW